MKGGLVKTRFVAAVPLIALVIGAVWIVNQPHSESAPTTSDQPVSATTVGSQRYRLEIADSDSERVRGLSGRKALATDTGMLFVFEQPGNYSFWMKDTLIALDMIWLSTEHQVVEIVENVQPGTYPQTYGGQEIAQYVIELAAGEVAGNGLSIGDTVEL